MWREPSGTIWRSDDHMRISIDRQRLRAFFESDRAKQIDKFLNLSFRAWIVLVVLFLCMLLFVNLLAQYLGYGETVYKDVFYFIQMIGTVATIVALVLGMVNKAPLNLYSWGFGIASILADKGTDGFRFYTMESGLAIKLTLAWVFFWIQAVGVSAIMALCIFALAQLISLAISKLRPQPPAAQP